MFVVTDPQKSHLHDLETQLVGCSRYGYLTIAMAHGRGNSLNRERIGQEFLLPYDELKRPRISCCRRRFSRDMYVRVRLRHCSCAVVRSSSCRVSCLTAYTCFRHGAARSTCICGTTKAVLFLKIMLCGWGRGGRACRFAGTGEGVKFSLERSSFGASVLVSFSLRVCR